jgi:predicted nuclease of predicted toxin-antitoxin system
VRFLLDEGLPLRLGACLSSQGHDVSAVGRDHPYALSDHAILAIAREERRIILTNDKDFGDLIFRDRLPHAGVILFRLGYEPIDGRIKRLERVLIDHAAHLNRFIVVTAQSVRVRPSSSESEDREDQME